jgi:hypothetical protein
MSCNRQFLTRGETLRLLYIEGGIVGTDYDSDTHRTSRANLERLAIAVGERMSLGLANLKTPHNPSRSVHSGFSRRAL